MACPWSHSGQDAGQGVTSGQTQLGVPLHVIGEKRISEVAGVLAQPLGGLWQVSLPPGASGLSVGQEVVPGSM